MRSNSCPTEPDRCERGPDAVAYALDALTDAERLAFERHADGCSACLETAQASRAAAQRVRDALAKEPTRDLLPGILDRLPAWAQESAVADTTHAFLFRSRFALRAAALVLALLAGAVLTVRRPASRQKDHHAFAKAEPAAAVMEALRWLASVQGEDGAWHPESWGGRAEFETGLTGLAALTFLRHGDGRHALAAKATPRAAAFLLASQESDGGFGPTSSGRMYNHGIVSVALLEAYRRGLAPEAEPSLKSALNYLVAQQHDGGGWGYSAHPASRPNTSVSVWPLEALALGVGQGWTEYGAALEQGLHWLGSLANEQGQFGYWQTDDTADHAALTAMGAYCLFKTAGVSSAIPADRTKLRLALTRVADESAEGRLDYYRSYFVASAVRAGADPQNQPPLARLRDRLFQERSLDATHAGSWNPSDRWSGVGGRLYATSMAALALDAESR